MEFILECILNFFGDFLLQLICELVLEFGLRRFAVTAEPEKCMPMISFFGYGILGLFAGGLSLLLFPHPFVHSSRFHGISLLITPILTGFAMSGVGWLRKKQDKVVLRIDTFSYGFIFAFGIALIRLIYTK
jgi:hypothetical protein